MVGDKDDEDDEDDEDNEDLEDDKNGGFSVATASACAVLTYFCEASLLLCKDGIKTMSTTIAKRSPAVATPNQ